MKGLIAATNRRWKWMGRLTALGAVLVSMRTSLAQFAEPDTVVLQTFTGQFAGDQFGWVSEDVGDLSGDGVHEVAIGAPGNDIGGAERGRVYVYNGATGVLAFPAIPGAINGGRLGHAVGSVQDVNGDGKREILGGAPSAGQGRIGLYSGADGSLIRTIVGEAGGDLFGWAVRGFGDLNGDGIGDVLIGAPGNDAAGAQAGRAYVYSGAAGSQRLCALNGVDANDSFGGSLDVVGDVNHDGTPDFVVAAETAAAGGGAGTGFAYVYSGAACLLPPSQPSPLQVLEPIGVAAAFGQFFVDGEGDVDGDGTPDIYVSDFNVNKAYVFSGATGSVISTYFGDGDGGFGIGRIVGDVDDDGWADLILGAWFSSAGANQAGKAFVYSGRTGGVLQTFTHTVVGAHLGFDANGMGDVNSDGRMDFLLTAADDASSRGKAYLVAGNTATFSRADVDLDGDVDSDDAVALATSIVGLPVSMVQAKRADVDRNGFQDGRDVAAFVGYALQP